MTKPTVVCVPGAWHTPEIYTAVFEILNAHGYPTVGCPLASVGATPPHSDFTGDVTGIRDCLTRLVAAEEKEVILVVHSYGGMPGTEAPIGLGKKEREEKGLKGGVIRLVYIMAFAMPEGWYPLAGDPEWPPFMTIHAESGKTTISAENAKPIFYNDMSSEEGDKWAAKLLHHCTGVYSSTTTYAAWRHIPSTYVVCTQDKSTFTPEIVDMMIKGGKEMQPTAFDVVETCDAGHSPMISRPEWLAGVLRRAAGEAC